MIKKVLNFFKKIFSSSKSFLEANAAKAVHIVQAVKDAVNNPLLDIITALTRTKVDDLTLAKVRFVLAKVAEEMLIAEKIIGVNKTEADILNALMEYLSVKTPDARAKYYIELSGRIAVILSDGQVTLAEAISLAQFIYAQNQQ